MNHANSAVWAKTGNMLLASKGLCGPSLSSREIRQMSDGTLFILKLVVGFHESFLDFLEFGNLPFRLLDYALCFGSLPRCLVLLMKARHFESVLLILDRGTGKYFLASFIFFARHTELTLATQTVPGRSSSFAQSA